MKLVAEVGVGTVAAGVAKANADHVLISGPRRRHRRLAALVDPLRRASRGRSASPRRSRRSCCNDLRSRIWVQTDGQLKTGRDVVVAALLGADEMGFATAPLIATRLRDDARLPPEHVPGRHRDAGSRAARAASRASPSTSSTSSSSSPRRCGGSWPGSGSRASRSSSAASTCSRPTRRSSTGRTRGIDLSRSCTMPESAERLAASPHAGAGLAARRRARLAADRGARGPRSSRGAGDAASSRSATSNRTVGGLLSHEVTKRHGAQGLPPRHDPLRAPRLGRAVVRRLARARDRADARSATRTTTPARGSRAA